MKTKRLFLLGSAVLGLSGFACSANEPSTSPANINVSPNARPQDDGVKSKGTLIFDVVAVAPGAGCAAGGQAFRFGNDLDRDGFLDDNEVTRVERICNGETGAKGADGKTPVLKSTPEPVGTRCPTGGQAISWGYDTNANAALDTNEIAGTTFVCNGLNGSNGSNGSNGKNSLATIIDIDAGDSRCGVAGGKGIYTGVDLDGDGLLQPSEVQSTSFVCDGARALVTQAAEPNGANCTYGGLKIETGTDSDSNGALSSAEIANTSFVCNGATGATGPAGPAGSSATSSSLIHLSVAVAPHHACAVMSDRTARCWGDNAFGQLGDGTTMSHDEAVTVPNLTNVVAIAAGGDDDGTTAHTCVVLGDGSVRCWGKNGSGQLGDRSTVDRLSAVAPYKLSGVATIATGAAHSCAVRSDGTVWCWGENGDGQLATGKTFDMSAPVAAGITAVKTLETREVFEPVVGALGLTAAGGRTCALISPSEVSCWGKGFGVTPEGTVGDARSIAAGSNHVCASLLDGTFSCGGDNSSGQLGAPTATNATAWIKPLVVEAGETTTGAPYTSKMLGGGLAVSAGRLHSCAIVTGGAVRCWGTIDGVVKRATALTDALSVRSIASGGDRTCAIVLDGSLQCWSFPAEAPATDTTDGGTKDGGVVEAGFDLATSSP